MIREARLDLNELEAVEGEVISWLKIECHEKQSIVYCDGGSPGKGKVHHCDQTQRKPGA